MALVVMGAIGALIVGALIVVWSLNESPLPLADRCVATVQGETVTLDPDQAHYASIIAGVAGQRGLAPRAVSIAIATVYQESGIRNLDYGDRDSLGLFQQRPSQGWGTPTQVMDPWFASNAFYAALVKVPDWSTGDINDVAQAVQRSGHPNGYARHVDKARRIGSSLSGESAASFSCVVRSPASPDPTGLADFLAKTLPRDVAITRTTTGLSITSSSTRGAWSAAHIVVANAGSHGVQSVTAGGRTWQASRTSLPPWEGDEAASKTVEVTFAVTPTPTTTP